MKSTHTNTTFVDQAPETPACVLAWEHIPLGVWFLSDKGTVLNYRLPMSIVDAWKARGPKAGKIMDRASYGVHRLYRVIDPPALGGYGVTREQFTPNHPEWGNKTIEESLYPEGEWVVDFPEAERLFEFEPVVVDIEYTEGMKY